MTWFPRRKPASQNARPSVHTGGTLARAYAEAGLAAQKAQQPEVDRVAESLRELRERNHFAAQIRMIFLGGHTE